MEFKPLTAKQRERLQSLVAPERFSTGTSVLDLHARDQSPHAACRPEAVIWPVSGDEVSRIVEYAGEQCIPVTGWGSGSSLEGNPIPVCGGLILDFSGMNRIVAIREEEFQADVEPGVVYQDLNTKLRHTGLFFPPDPGARATIGGMIANNASGPRTVHYGSTKDYVLRLTMVLASGEIVEFGSRAGKSSSGYDLIRLFVGSEGTLGLVVRATVRLVALPAEFSAAVATFPTVESAGKAVLQLMRAGLNPAALELLGAECVALMNREERLNLNPSPTLFMEFHGTTTAQLAEVLELAAGICREENCVSFRPGLGRSERDSIFKARHGLGEMILRNHPGSRLLIMDVAVPIGAYPELIAAIQAEMAATDLVSYTISHAGDGNVHLNILEPRGGGAGWGRIQDISERLVNEALALGGTATGEHGVGLGKRKYMAREHGSGLIWMKRIKQLFDPKGILNPGKIFPDPQRSHARF